LRRPPSARCAAAININQSNLANVSQKQDTLCSKIKPLIFYHRQRCPTPTNLLKTRLHSCSILTRMHVHEHLSCSQVG